MVGGNGLYFKLNVNSSVFFFCGNTSKKIGLEMFT